MAARGLRALGLLDLVKRLLGIDGAVPPHAADRNSLYDQQTGQVMRALLSPTDCCVDVGAPVGDLLGRMFECAPHGRHYAIEPLPALARDRRVRFPKARVVEAALGDAPGRAAFNHVLNDPAYSGLRKRAYDRPDPLITQIDVQVLRLDDVVAAGEQLRLIKIDVEGGEYAVLRGAARILSESRPVVIFEAGYKSSGFYDVTPDLFFDLFAANGYSVSTMERWLNGAAPFDRPRFREAWDHDYYFMAYPADPPVPTSGNRDRPGCRSG